MSITSHFSTFLSLSGVTGLFITHGSMRISFHLALCTFHDPWPSQVKLTSALSAIHAPSFIRTRGRVDLMTEKPIFPQRQHEHPDCTYRPQVREEQDARLA